MILKLDAQYIQKIAVKTIQKSKGSIKVKTLQAWYPLIKREFPEDEKDFGEWYYA